MRSRRNEIANIILKGLLFSGAIIISGNSPRFFSRTLPKIIECFKYQKKSKEIEKRKFYNAFYNLKKQGMVKMEYQGKQLYISLTDEGKKRCGKFKVDDLKIKKPFRWDKKWRILIFDVKEKQRIKREALRGKLKELGLFQLQKSVWICPYDFFREADILRNFFGFSDKEIKVIIASKVENDQEIKTFFGFKGKKH